MTRVPADEQPGDPGLARERTALAWNRSGLAVIVCIAVVLRHLWPLKGKSAMVALGIVAAMAIAWALTLLAFRIGRSRHRDRSRYRNQAFGLVTAGTVVLAVVAVVLTVLVPG